MITVQLPNELKIPLNTLAQQTGRSVDDCVQGILSAYFSPKQNHLTPNKPHSQYDVFNFDLERMEKALSSGFVNMPDTLKSPDEIGEWLLSVAE